MNTHFVEIDGFDDKGYFWKLGYIEDGKRVFENNLNPPTHFIEVFGEDGVTNQTEDMEEIIDIEYLKRALSSTIYHQLNTIAIFKIRPRY